jgi:hypothetical protein
MARHPIDVLEKMATEHVLYEVQMMASTARRQTPAGDLVLGFAVLESFLLHCRNLAEFLTKANPSGTDLAAKDYFDQPWAGATLPTDFDIKAIHRRLAHLTTDRLATNVPGQGFSWAGPTADRARRAVQIRRAFGQFRGDLASVHPDRAVWFDDCWQLLRQLR